MAVVAVAAAWNINQSENEIKLSDLALDNVEALASGEGGSGYAVTLGEDVLSNIPMGHPLTTGTLELKFNKGGCAKTKKITMEYSR